MKLPRSQFLYFMKRYICIYVFMHIMHMSDKITLQVSRNVRGLVWETFTYMTMDAEHNRTTPTIAVHRSHEDYDIHITHISKNHRKINIVESSSGNVYTLKWTLSAMELLPRYHSLNFMNIMRCSPKNNVRSWSRNTQIDEFEKKQGQMCSWR